jgi:protein tyrosine phosphatase (PTP) superfamily phosphohydrolase (DUF442 family)
MRWSRRTAIRLALGASATLGLGASAFWDEAFEKRVAEVVPGRVLRGAWQRPWPLRRLLARAGIRTVVTLTAINRDDPKYVRQARVVREAGVDWVIVPMRGSRATLAQMAEAADLLADPARQPVFFHCVAGHHRSSLVHAAYLIRHRGYPADRAWREVAALPWSRPDAGPDRGDRRLIEAFAASELGRGPGRSPVSEDVDHARVHARTPSRATRPAATPDPPADPGPAAAGGGGVRRVEPGDWQLRDGPPRAGLPVGAVAGVGPGPGPS